MRFSSFQSLLTVCAVFSAVSANYTLSHTEDNVIYITSVIQETLTVCATPSVISSCSAPQSSELGIGGGSSVVASTSGSNLSSGIVASSSLSSNLSSVSSGTLSGSSATGTVSLSRSSVSSGSIVSTSSISSVSGTSSITGSSSVSGSSSLGSSTVSGSSSLSSSSVISGSTSSGSSTWQSSSQSSGSVTSTVSSSVSSTPSGSSSVTVPTSTSSASSSETSTLPSSSPTSSSQSASSSPTSSSSSIGSSSSSVASSSSTTISTTASTTSGSSTSSGSSTQTSSSSQSSSTTSLSSSTTSSQSSSTSSLSSSSTSQTSSSTSSSSSSSTSSLSSSSTSQTSSSSTSQSSSSTSHTSTTSSSTTSSSSTSSASATPTCYYWMENIKNQGIAAFNVAPNDYQVFRNVKDAQFGAKGDGVTDDTAAINRAISGGGRCGPSDCSTSTVTPAVIYFPPGTYLVSGSIIDFYNTQIIGNPNCMPVIKATSNFVGSWIIDGDQYQNTGKEGWISTNVFWRQIRNFVIDMTSVPVSNALSAIHWPTGQATSLQNIVIKMSSDLGTQHRGVLIEDGSGGFMTDITFYGGNLGMWNGNQQFTMRNLTFYNAVTAIHQDWDWGWTYKGISINNCTTGLDMSGLTDNNQNVDAVVFIDSEITDTTTGFLMARGGSNGYTSGGSLILENVSLNNVGKAVVGPSGVVLAGVAGKETISWGQGHEYTPTGPTAFQGAIAGNTRPSILTSSTGAYYQRSKPQYEHLVASNFVSVRDHGAVGDGKTDDTIALNKILASAAANGQIVFFDAGDYLVTSTISIPAGSKIVGETYPVILSSGSYFTDMTNPKPVVQVGTASEVGSVEWSDMIVSTKGAQAGAILIEYNLAAPAGSTAGLWDVHTRVGGFIGSDLQFSDCPAPTTTPYPVITSANLNQECIAAFMSMHITASASNLYMENNWLWVADHDADDHQLRQITVYAGRGLLIESTLGGIWLVGTAVEHHTLYQYQISGAGPLFMGQIQTETAYYQPNPEATIPFPAVEQYNDPVFTKGASQSGWGLRVVDSTDLLIYGAGLYSFFNNYDNSACPNQGVDTCQSEIFSVDATSSVFIYNLNTVGVPNMITRAGVDIAKYVDNVNSFAASIAVYKNV